MQKGALVNSTPDRLKKSRLRERTDWFSRLAQHPASKQSGSVLTTPEPTWGCPEMNQSTKFTHSFLAVFSCQLVHQCSEKLVLAHHASNVLVAV